MAVVGGLHAVRVLATAVALPSSSMIHRLSTRCLQPASRVLLCLRHVVPHSLPFVYSWLAGYTNDVASIPHSQRLFSSGKGQNTENGYKKTNQ